MTTNFVRNPLCLALLTALAFPAAVLAQTPPPAPAPTDSDATRELDRITVTGSRIKRAEVEGPAPVTVITREEMDREGFQTVADVLQTLSQNTSSSFTGDLAVTGFSPNAQVVNLRNLGPGQTLTLINGRRPAQYPQPYNRDNNVVNVRAIPSSAIERIEILTGGASAIYGSDAVAGVVNIVLRQNYEGNQIRTTVGTTAEGGGDYVNAEYMGGRVGDRWTAMIAAQYAYREPVFADQREFLESTRSGPLGNLANPALSLVALRVSAHPSGPTNHNAFYPGAEACERLGFITVTTAARGLYCGSVTQAASRSISNKNEFYSVYGSGTFDITPDLQMFGSFMLYDQNAKSSSGTEFWGTAGDRFNQTAAGGATSAYFDPTFGHLVQLQRVFGPDELGGPEAASTLYDEQSWEVAGGVAGSFGQRFDWEFTLAHSEYDYKADRPRLLAQAVHNYFLGPPTGQFVSGFPVSTLNRERWISPLTPEIYRSISTRVINRGTTASSTANFTVNGDLWQLPAGPIGFAGILEAGRQETDLISDPRTSQTRPLDAQTIYNLTSSGETHGSRDRYALGAELRIPLLTTLTAQLAARYDKYDDITAVDDAITYNAGLEFRPIDSLLFRASYATSFRAPDMQLVFAEGAASFSTILDEYSCRSGTGLGLTTGPRTRPQCNVSGDPTIYQAQTLIAGNPLLKEEEGKSFTGGFVWDILDQMSVSVDYYRVRLEDAALQLSAAYLLENEANCRLGLNRDGSPFQFAANSTFCQNITSLISRQTAPGTNLDGRIDRINSAYINSALRDTSGIDATFRYGYETNAWGSFAMDLSYSLVLTNKYKQFPDAELIDYRNLDELFFNERSRVRGSIGWRMGDWSTTVFGTRYGSTFSFAGVDGTNAAGESYPRRLPPYMLYNLTVGKRINQNLTTQLQIINVLDNQYRYDASQTGYPFFTSFIGADPLGRRFNFTVAYTF
jgi:iron complex outermembrane recepter protein